MEAGLNDAGSRGVGSRNAPAQQRTAQILGGLVSELTGAPAPRLGWCAAAYMIDAAPVTTGVIETGAAPMRTGELSGRIPVRTMTIPAPQHGHTIRARSQGYEAVAVAFGVADVHTRPCGIHIAHLQAQPFAQTQAEAIEGGEEHAVAQHTGVQQ